MNLQNASKLTFRLVSISFLFSLLSCSGITGGQSKLALDKGEISTATASQENKLATWETKPKVVSNGNGLDMLLKTSGGMNFIYAKRNQKGRQDLFYTSSHNMGDTFMKSYPINKASGGISANGENNPKIRKGHGIEMFAMWQTKNAIKFSRSMNFGRSFGPEITVNDGPKKGSYNFQTMGVSPDGTIYIAWLDSRDYKTNPKGTSSIYIARSLDQGKTFGENIKVAGSICPCCRPAIAFGNDGQVFIAWRHVYPGHNRVIVVASSKDKGQTWSKEQRVTQDGWVINGCAHSGPTMKYAKGKLYIVWYSGTNNKASLKSAVSNDNGQSFRYLGEVQGDVFDSNHPDLQIVNGEPWIIFQGREPDKNNGWGNVRPWLTKISGNGKISKPEKLPFLGNSVSYPSLYVGGGGRIYATWTEMGDSGSKAVLCRGRVNS